MSSSCVSSSSGGGTVGMVNWCCTGLPWESWKEAWQMKIGFPCWMAFTERTEKLFPVRVRSTSYSTGTLGSPGRGKGRSALGHSAPRTDETCPARHCHPHPPCFAGTGMTAPPHSCELPKRPSHCRAPPEPPPAVPAARSRFPGRTCPHEVAVQRVHLLVAVHGMGCRHQRLPHDLPAEEALRGGHPVVPAPAGRRRPR